MTLLICWNGLCKNFRFVESIANNSLKAVYFINYSTNDGKDANSKTENTKETSENQVKEKNQLNHKNSPVSPPEEPTTCCMSGCANCVWLDYAEKLCEYYKDGGEQAIKEVNERISDPNIKAYILHEIRMRNKK